MGAHYLYFTIFLACFGAFLSMTVIGWSSPMVERLKSLEDNPLGRRITETEDSLLASLSFLGSFAGCIVVAVIGSKIGSKTLLVTEGCIILFFYLLMVWAQSIWLLFIGRFMTGVGIGGIFSILPIYCGELAETKNRGIINTSTVIFMNGGNLYSAAAGPYLSYFWFHMSLVTFSTIFVVLFYLFAPESPYYLVKSDRSKAEQVLRKLRGDRNFDKILDQMEETNYNDSQSSFLEIFNSKSGTKSLIIAIGGFTFMLLTGLNIMISYTQRIMKDAGGSVPPEEGPIIIIVIQLITSIVISLISDRFPRKNLLTFSHVGISLAEIPLAIYFYLQRNDSEILDSISWLPFICLLFFFTMYSSGVGPILMTLLSELFPPKIKNVLVSWMIAYHLGGSFVLTLFFNRLEEAIGFDSLLLISAVSGFLAVIFVRMCMIETMGKTLQEIQDELGSKPSKPKLIAMDEVSSKH